MVNLDLGASASASADVDVDVDISSDALDVRGDPIKAADPRSDDNNSLLSIEGSSSCILSDFIFIGRT